MLVKLKKISPSTHIGLRPRSVAVSLNEPQNTLEGHCNQSDQSITPRMSTIENEQLSSETVRPSPERNAAVFSDSKEFMMSRYSNLTPDVTPPKTCLQASSNPSLCSIQTKMGTTCKNLCEDSWMLAEPRSPSCIPTLGYIKSRFLESASSDAGLQCPLLLNPVTCSPLYVPG